MPDQAPKSPASGPAEQKSPVRPGAPCGEPVPWIPESKLPPLPKNSVNSNVRKILLASPMFPRFYADMVIATAPNSNEAKILAKNYQKIIDRINMSNPKSCTHIKVTGIPCGSPTLRGEQFCYFHQHAHRGVRKPPQSRLHPIAILEDEESIQASLMEVVNALMRNTIDMKRAELILRALHIAVKNARRVKFAVGADSMVKEVPDYAEPNVGTATAHVGTDAFVRPGGPEVPGRSAVAATRPADETESDLPAVAATAPKPLHPDPTFWEHWEAGGKELARSSAQARAAEATPAAATARVGTDAPVRTSGPEVPVRSAFAAPVPYPTKKKPPVSVKAAPKERKNAAHRASGG